MYKSKTMCIVRLGPFYKTPLKDPLFGIRPPFLGAGHIQSKIVTALILKAGQYAEKVVLKGCLKVCLGPISYFKGFLRGYLIKSNKRIKIDKNSNIEDEF